MDYSKLNMKELDDLTYLYLIGHQYTDNTSESDKSINDISRARLELYHSEHGKCYLCKLTLLQQLKKDEPYPVIEFTGQDINSFDYDFVIPYEDPEIIALLKKRNKTGNKSKINWIAKRLVEIGGINLIWQ